ncbi:ABC transporter permease [Sulfurimonas sp.]|uniref:ABC transporter permease n=1 Tax=Sulfurimonas sp. TaxID=2022749 RepID=UPI003D145997
MIRFNPQLFAFALQSLFRFFSKNLFTAIIYTLLVMLLSSLFLIHSSLKAQVQDVTNRLPDIVLQNQKALKYTTINDENIDKIYEIYGVSDVQTRVYGSYEYKQGNKTFKIVGVDLFEIQKDPFFDDLLQKYELKPNMMLVSSPLAANFAKHYYLKEFNFIKPSLKVKSMKITGSFESNLIDKRELCVMSKEDAKEIFGFADNEVSDIAIYLSNQNELANVVSKLQQLYPNAKIITKVDEQTKVSTLFDYDSGIFITLFIIAIFTFFMIIFEKTNGVTSAEKREIGILKALGWRVEDILQTKMYEAVVVSFFSYSLGVALAFMYLYFFDGVYLRDIFLNIIHVNEIDKLPLSVELQPLALVFFLSVPIYMAAILIPSWKIATMDADEVMR